MDNLVTSNDTLVHVGFQHIQQKNIVRYLYILRLNSGRENR